MSEATRIALAYAAIALLVRAPALLHAELNWDEALYWQIAGELVSGHLPYTETWDRKPPGLFMLLAALQALAGDSMVALRLGTTLAVAASAVALRDIARRLLPGLPGAATLAGLVYIACSMRSNGAATNAELLVAPFALGAMALALGAAGAPRRRAIAIAIAAGMLGGWAMLIKPIAMAEGFTILALLALPALRPRAMAPRALLPLLAALGVGLFLPLILVAAWYAGAGRLHLLVAALTAAGEAGQAGFYAPGLIDGLREFSLPALATAGAIVALALGAAGPAGRRAAASLLLWLGAVGVILLVLGRFTDHMMIQVLPPLAIGAGAAAGLLLGLRRATRWQRAASAAMALLLLGWGAFPAVNAGFETAWHRQVDGVRHWGDRTATLAAVMRDRLEARGDLYVAGRTLGLYHATGIAPATRFPFTIHLWAAYAPVDGPAEVARIMAGRPRFVVIDDLWLPGRPRDDALQARVLSTLAAAMAADYVAEGRTGRFTSWRGGFVGGGIGATVFRRRDIAPWRPGSEKLQYEAPLLALAAP